MAPATDARPQPLDGSFDILDDGAPLRTPVNGSAEARDALEELSVDHKQNHPAAFDTYLCAQSATDVAAVAEKASYLPAHSSEAKSNRPKIAWRASRNRRPLIEAETFEPLDAVLEEPSLLSGTEETLPAASPPAVDDNLAQPTEREGGQPVGQHPLTCLDASHNVQEQVDKHLAGQFEWLITCPAPASSAAKHETHDEGSLNSACESLVYGCNFLRRSQRSGSAEGSETGHEFADTYAFLATPLKADASTLSEMDGLQGVVAMNHAQPPPYPEGALKAFEVVMKVGQALSPSFSASSEMTDTLESSSGAGSFSLPRIEDSLEELDKLEDELEAVNAATLPGAVATVGKEQPKATSKTPAEQKTVPMTKRTSLAGQSATVRIKPSQKTKPALRRSTSMTLRDKEQSAPSSAMEQKPSGTPSRHQASAVRAAATLRSPAKSTKPPTVPSFELPGEAVARRLKEQRQARQALQAEALKAQATPSKPRSNRPLAKPTFELPGEAISRRKREEREAKLRAEEAEEKKRREFKARPVRHSMGPATLPRETIASRARQNRMPHDEGEGQKSNEANKTRRMSAAVQARGRLSTVMPASDWSRATSSSTMTSSKRSTLSVEEIAQQRLRGKEILARDSTYATDKVRDRRDRESAAKLARDEAAERSRIASREWAEKKRRKELAALAATQTKTAAGA